MRDDRVEQRLEVLPRHRLIAACRPDPGVGVEHGEPELLLGGIEIDEQVVDLVQHFLRPRIGPVDLVDHDDWREPALERLPKHEPRLGERPLRRVDEQHHAVHHRQGALHLAAEVGVPGCVDNVDQEVFVMDRGVLGENRDAALALEIGVVEGALGHPLVGPERAALVQERVDERRLAVIDVRDDRHVPPQRVGHVGLAG